jgi:hypothetical protein
LLEITADASGGFGRRIANANKESIPYRPGIRKDIVSSLLAQILSQEEPEN